MISVGFVPISGNGARPSIFGSTLAQETGFHRLGQAQTATQDWLDRVESVLSRYRTLQAHIEKINSKSERDQITAWIGTSDQAGTLASTASAVETMVRTAQVPDSADSTLKTLNAQLDELEAKVKNAETAFGTAPAASPAPPSSGGTPWIMPLAVVGAVLVAIGVTIAWGD